MDTGAESQKLKQLQNTTRRFRSFASVMVAVLAAACGGESSWCPGTVCSNCATDPACYVSCSSGRPACVGGAFFDADPDLRCGFCQ